MLMFLSEVECGPILTDWQKKVKSENSNKQIIYNITCTVFGIQIKMYEASQETKMIKNKQTRKSVNKNRLEVELDSRSIIIPHEL